MSNYNTHSKVENLAINITTAGDNTIIAGAADRWIYIHSIHLLAVGAETITLKAGSTALTGPEPLTAGQGYIFESSYATDTGDILFECKPGDAFIINLLTGADVVGFVKYSFRK